MEAATRLLRVPPSKIKENEDLFQNKIWIADADVGFRLCGVQSQSDTDVVVGFRDEQGFFEKKRVALRDVYPVSCNSLADDLCQLSEPNAATVLDALTRRYGCGVIHTYSGLFCVSVNPWKHIPIYEKEIMELYRDGVDTLPPHVYNIAQLAYEGVKKGGSNQSILITGESGAGKTENTKRIIEYILHACGQRGDRSLGSSMQSSVISCGQLLESFGNARTTHNSNSSRFGKFIRIDFDDQGQLQSAQIECYLLEKSRVVMQNAGERNFHVFYQLLSSAFGEQMRAALSLTQSASGYKYLNQGNASKDTAIDDLAAARVTDAAMQQIGLSDEQRMGVYEILAACVLIGEIRFNERTGLDMSYVEGQKEVDAVSDLLSIKSSKLVDALTQPTINVGGRMIRKNQNLKKTLFSAAGLAKVLYERLFNWLLDKCNAAISENSFMEQSSVRRFIGVLDIAGFEIMTVNSFEQLCINYTNERLQQFFNHFVFIREQSEYLEEGLRWQHADYAVDLQGTIDLIEKPLGILSLLEEECVVPNGSDTALLDKLCTQLEKHAKFAKAKQSQRSQSNRHFSIAHYAGSVDYSLDGWVEKNRDTVETSMLELLGTTGHRVLGEMFPPVAPSTEMSRSRRGGLAASTVSYVYKAQLASLLDTLHSSSAHFVRCVVPNYDRQPGRVDAQLVLAQLRCNGVLEGIRICREGFPNRLSFTEFLEQYSILGGPDFKGYGRAGAQALCQKINMDPERFQIGNTKIFCKVGIVSELEQLRRDYIGLLITGLQAQIKSYVMEKDCYERLLKKRAMLTIQDNVREFAQVADWPWFRILQFVRAMIPKSREKEKIAALEQERQELAERQEQAARENLQLVTEMEQLRVQEENAAEEARRAKQAIEEAKHDKERAVRAARDEMRKNEEIFDVLEAKYNEQHAKVMKMNTALREYERRVEQMELERAELEREIKKSVEAAEREKKHRQHIEAEYEEATATIQEGEARLTLANEEIARLKLRIAKNETESEDEKEKLKRQAELIKELQNTIMELNDKIARHDSGMMDERNARRKLERDLERVNDDLTRAEESLDRQMLKNDKMKDTLREKDNEIKRLEKKLSDQEMMMKDVVQDLKEGHKSRVTELQEKLEEYRRKMTKLESENKTSKMIREFERESSVDSDYGRSSNGGSSGGSALSRQYSNSCMARSGYSLSSVGSFSSIRTIGRRRETEPDLGMSSSYISRRRETEPDIHSPPSIVRSPSTTQLFERDRKIAELERQLNSVNCELQISKRENEVYKQSLAATEAEKDSISKQNRQLSHDMDRLSNSTEKAEKNATSLEQRLKAMQGDVDNWRRRFDEAASEHKNDLMRERRKWEEKMSSVEHDRSLKLTRQKTMESVRDEMHERLLETQAELDRTLAALANMQRTVETQESLGDSWELQYRDAAAELQSLRDENEDLKVKIRRQYKQIELLTQHEETNDAMNVFESKIDRFRDC